MASWSELPDEINAMFAERLSYVEEFIKFSSVCTSWRSGAAQAKTRRKSFMPWMLLSKTTGDEEEDRHGVPCCYSFFSDKVFNLPLPELQGTRCWGTQYGWIIAVNLRDFQIHLYNPLTQTRFGVPPIPINTAFTRSQRSWYECIYQDNSWTSSPIPLKFALSSNPSESGESAVVVAVYGTRQQLAFASPNRQSWTLIDNAFPANHDVIFFKGRIYSVTVLGTLRMCDFSETRPLALDIASSPPKCDMCGTNLYLVEISGDLHLIVRRLEPIVEGSFEYHNIRTYGFNVYKFNFNSVSWTEVECLESHSLFVGYNTTFAISTSDYPDFKLKPNCIYFTGNQFELFDRKFCDMGVYDMARAAVIEPFYKQGDLPSEYCRPFFFMPSLA